MRSVAVLYREAGTFCDGNILARETAHTMGMPDVYDDENHELNCIMEKYNPVTAEWLYSLIEMGEAPFCDSCTEQMNRFTSGVYYRGN
ncbi:MAG: hypothetical protein IJZ94_01245 [Clostridia bacterium]|nr:hypothetical protein [Clostridia bacterium]